MNFYGTRIDSGGLSLIGLNRIVVNQNQARFLLGTIAGDVEPEIHTRTCAGTVLIAASLNISAKSSRPCSSDTRASVTS